MCTGPAAQYLHEVRHALGQDLALLQVPRGRPGRERLRPRLRLRRGARRLGGCPLLRLALVVEAPERGQAAEGPGCCLPGPTHMLRRAKQAQPWAGLRHHQSPGPAQRLLEHGAAQMCVGGRGSRRCKGVRSSWRERDCTVAANTRLIDGGCWLGATRGAAGRPMSHAESRKPACWALADAFFGRDQQSQATTMALVSSSGALSATRLVAGPCLIGAQGTCICRVASADRPIRGANLRGCRVWRGWLRMGLRVDWGWGWGRMQSSQPAPHPGARTALAGLATQSKQRQGLPGKSMDGCAVGLKALPACVVSLPPGPTLHGAPRDPRPCPLQ